MIGCTMSMNVDKPRPSAVTAARMSRASGSDTPKLPVMVSNGMAAQNSTFRSARPLRSKESMRACTVLSIHCSIHHRAFFGTKDGCTSVR